MKHYLKYSLAILSTAGFAQGALIAINNIDPGAGTNGSFTTTAPDPDTLVFTRNFDFDGGGVEDTLTFTLFRSTFNGSSTISGSDVTVGGVNNGGNTANWYSSFSLGESIELRVADISYVSGENDGTTAQFAGFTSIARVNFSTAGVTSAGAEIDYLIHTGPIGSTTITNSGGDLDLTSVGNSDTVIITAGEGALPIRLRDLDIVFETVPAPEPTSTMLLGLGGLALVLRRRR